MPSLRLPDGGERCFRRMSCHQSHMIVFTRESADSDDAMRPERMSLFEDDYIAETGPRQSPRCCQKAWIISSGQATSYLISIATIIESRDAFVYHQSVLETQMSALRKSRRLCVESWTNISNDLSL
jgi:hypothetical protein